MSPNGPTAQAAKAAPFAADNEADVRKMAAGHFSNGSGWQIWIDRGGTFTEVQPGEQLAIETPGGGRFRRQPRRMAVSISHSTRCLEVASRLTDTGRTRLKAG
jgi:hypothetical protein